MDSSASTFETSENVFFFDFIPSFVSFTGVFVYPHTQLLSLVPDPELGP